MLLDKVDQVLNGKNISDRIRRPLIDVKLTPMQCDKMDNLAKVMNEDYSESVPRKIPFKNFEKDFLER